MPLAGPMRPIGSLMTLLKNKGASWKGFLGLVPSLIPFSPLLPAPSSVPCAVADVSLPPPSALTPCPFPTLDSLPLLTAASQRHHLFSNPDY